MTAPTREDVQVTIDSSAVSRLMAENIALRAALASAREMARMVDDGRSHWVQVAEELLPYLRGNPQPVTIDVREHPTLPRVLDLVATRYACPNCATAESALAAAQRDAEDIAAVEEMRQTWMLDDDGEFLSFAHYGKNFVRGKTLRELGAAIRALAGRRGEG